MRVFGMLTALEAVRNRMYENYERGVTTWLYIDEVQSLFGHPTIIDYFAKFWAEGRKFNLICTGISQNTSHMLTQERARTMVLNSDFILLHKQASQDLAAWSDMLTLSAAEREYIDESIKAGEGLLVAGGARVPYATISRRARSTTSGTPSQRRSRSSSERARSRGTRRRMPRRWARRAWTKNGTASSTS